jgi:hypothetical protein
LLVLYCTISPQLLTSSASLYVKAMMAEPSSRRVVQESPQRHHQSATPVGKDALSLPLPPVSLDFAIRGDSKREGFLQRYVRRGDSRDATSAVVGKGGFGTAYRFVRDDSFTPPNSMLDTNNSGDTRQPDSGEEESIEALRGVSSHTGLRDMEESAQSLTEGALREHHDRRGIRLHQNSSTSMHSSFTSSAPPSPSATKSHVAKRSKAPAVIVIKVCRTPTSGSYDELPKTGKGREEAKAAAHELAEGKPVGQHTRIVRGEARLLRYLQMAQVLKKRKGQESYIVRLLADIPMPRAGHVDG